MQGVDCCMTPYTLKSDGVFSIIDHRVSIYIFTNAKQFKNQLANVACCVITIRVFPIIIFPFNAVEESPVSLRQ